MYVQEGSRKTKLLVILIEAAENNVNMAGRIFDVVLMTVF